MKQLDVIEEALLSMPRHKGDIVEKGLESLREIREEINILQLRLRAKRNTNGDI